MPTFTYHSDYLHTLDKNVRETVITLFGALSRKDVEHLLIIYMYNGRSTFEEVAGDWYISHIALTSTDDPDVHDVYIVYLPVEQ